MVLQRNSKGPQFKDTDRLFWVLYSRVVDGWQKILLIARRRTILDWQKNRFKKYWTRKRRRKRPGSSRADPNHEPSEFDLGHSAHHRGVGQIGNLGLQVDGRSISHSQERDAVADVEVISYQRSQCHREYRFLYDAHRDVSRLVCFCRAESLAMAGPTFQRDRESARAVDGATDRGSISVGLGAQAPPSWQRYHFRP